jgi:Na+/proline symporter
MIIILYFMFNAYAVSPLIGSPSEMYELLKKAGTQRTIEGNHNGSYITLKSNFGLIFGVIQLCSGSGTVFLDQAYWQRAIASKPSTAVRAYLLGGIAWFAIPFGFSTTLGLAAVALTDNPRFPTYPEVPTSGQISSGLAAAFAAETLMGQGGAVALLVVLFMAVTSCASAELIAVSSLLTFDVYKAYISPKASPKQLVFVSHLMICVFGLIMSVFACIWNAASIDLGWLFLQVFSHSYIVLLLDTNMLKCHGPPDRRCRLPNRLRHNMAKANQSWRYIWLSLRPCRRSHCMASNSEELLR